MSTSKLNPPGTAVVVGGCGLLGTFMVSDLLAAGCKSVRVVDARPPSCSVDGVIYFQHRLGSDDKSKLQNAFKGADCVFNMITPDVLYATLPMFNLTNVVGVKEIIEACLLYAVPRLVHIASIAVTDHFTPSQNQKESDPLPPLETYRGAYDRTKRLGEELVLEANCSKLATCSLRPGGILISHRDYIFRDCFANMRIDCAGNAAPCDFVDVHDVCRAAILAFSKLDDKGVAGEAFFISGNPNKCDYVYRKLGEETGYPVNLLSDTMWWTIAAVFDVTFQVRKYSPILLGLAAGVAAWYAASLSGRVDQRTAVVAACSAAAVASGGAVALGFGANLPALPVSLFMKMQKVPMVFDQSKAAERLGWRPTTSVEESVKRIVAEYKADQKDSANKQK